jgi:hypothetical protein
MRPGYYKQLEEDADKKKFKACQLGISFGIFPLPMS